MGRQNKTQKAGNNKVVPLNANPEAQNVPKPPPGIIPKKIHIIPVSEVVKDRIAETDLDIIAKDKVLKEELGKVDARIAAAVLVKKDSLLTLTRAEKTEEIETMKREMILLKIQHNNERNKEADLMYSAICSTNGYKVEHMQDTQNEDGDIVCLVPEKID